MKKLIRYRLPVSRRFPKGHPRQGEETRFIQKILANENINADIEVFKTPEFCDYSRHDFEPKLHTIRANYLLWEKRMKKVQAGEAVIELFYWEGKPYRSKQIVFATLNKDSGCGVQIIEFCKDKDGVPSIKYPIIGRKAEPEIADVAKHDGLSLEDFKAWFKGYDLSKPLAIIQFTKFRY